MPPDRDPPHYDTALDTPNDGLSISDSNTASIADFIDTQEDKADGTVTLYRSQLRNLAAVVDPTPLTDLTEQDLDAIDAWLADRDLAQPTITSYATTLKRFLEWADRAALASTLPERLTATDAAAADLRPILFEPDVYAIIEHTEALRYRALFEFLWQTGLRVSDARAVSSPAIEESQIGVDPVEITELTFTLPHAPAPDGPPTTAPDDWYTVTFTEHTAPYVFEWYQHASESNRTHSLWRDPTADAVPDTDKIRYRLQQAADRAGLDMEPTPRRLRQSRAIHLVYHGQVTGVEELRDRFDWSATTQTAQQYWEQAQRRAAQDDREWIYCATCTAAIEPPASTCYRCGNPPGEAVNGSAGGDDLAAHLAAIHAELEALHETTERQTALLEALLAERDSTDT